MSRKLAKLALAVLIVAGLARINTPAQAASAGCEALDGFSASYNGGLNNFGPYDLEAGERIRVTVSNVAPVPGATVTIAATVGGVPIGGTLLADDGVVNITVPADLSVAFSVSGTFVSADVSVSCSAPDEDGDTSAQPTDNRFNFGFGDTDVVLFPSLDGVGLSVYGVDENGAGYLVFTITADDLAAFEGNPPAENTLIKESADGKFKLYALTTGEFQLNIGPDEEGKTLVLIFDELSPDNLYGYVLE